MRVVIVFATISMFGFMLGLVALFGKLGYEHGWWGNGSTPASIAVVVAVVATAGMVSWIMRMTR